MRRRGNQSMRRDHANQTGDATMRGRALPVSHWPPLGHRRAAQGGRVRAIRHRSAAGWAS